MYPCKYGNRVFSRYSTPRSRCFSAISRCRAPEEVPDYILQVRREERKALYALRDQAEDLVRHVESARQRFANLPAPESFLNPSSGRKQYIPLERYRIAKEADRIASTAINAIREIQNHCTDLEQEPYRDWRPGDPDVITRMVEQSSPNLVPFENEEKEARRAVDVQLEQQDAILREPYRLTAIAKSVAERNGGGNAGSTAAFAHIKEIIEKQRGTTSSKFTSDSTRKVPHKAEAAREKANDSLVSASWDDMKQQVLAQQEQDEAAAAAKGKV